jgi:succinoglycan biosynthesis protein ExoA
VGAGKQGVNAVPRVSVIVPARNEAAHIAACVRSIVEQEVSGGIEVIVADGRSTDDTAALARDAGALVVDNPREITPAGLNAALAAARGEVVVRFDGHAEMPPGYVAACVRALDEEPGALSVGGWVQIDGAGPWARALAAALASRLGTGNPRPRRAPSPGDGRVDVDGFAFGAWRADVLRDHGGWDERFLRNQDFELSHRLRRSGGRVVFDPAIWSTYHPRESYARIARQYWDYGLFKALTFTTAPDSIRPRQLAPLGLLATGATALTPTRIARPARAALVLYAAALAVATVRSNGGWRTFPTLATVHGAWGSGLVVGLAGIAVRHGRGFVSRAGFNRPSSGKEVDG